MNLENLRNEILKRGITNSKVTARKFIEKYFGGFRCQSSGFETISMRDPNVESFIGVRVELLSGSSFGV